MKKILTAASICLASFGIAGLANAETWSPPGAIALASDGNLEVEKGILLQCKLSGSVDSTGADASVGSLALSGGFLNICGTISFSGLPYALVGHANNTVTLKNVNVAAVSGNCAGDLNGSFDQSTGKITFNDAQIPSTGSGSPCVINGVVSTNPQSSFTVP
ncbi:hypothetical protein [Microbulbifer variabilis]|uniref:Protein activator of alkane oxidation PraB n=1 Tax=Microbulbifer variabilis TaxID=266805 RepID=A0ABY4VBL0_9GAMM|nr:hypothetical protein [Microbulbifer variabilis]USD20265.1 hypothetical protein MJO52_14415 [Microbulbifer variabilis]